jgi:hypothetical protein
VIGCGSVFIWVSPASADAPFRATHSWLLGDARPLAVVIALLAAAGFVLARIGFITEGAWWAYSGIGAGAVASCCPANEPVDVPCPGRSTSFTATPPAGERR